MSKNKIKNITIIGEDSANISEGCVDVYVTLKNDERTYFLEFTTPQALTSEMVENKKGFVEPRFPFLIVQKLTPEIIREAITNGGKQHMTEVLAAIESTNAIAYTENAATKQAQAAKQIIEILPDNKYRDALIDLTEFAISRTL